ncbi:MAG: glycosyltransferase family 39 protein [Candidatus Omnitrophica bacterium]|nr:glycosyltransferase family 39 protein [Candidatus Omnitrophota bacterium]
MKTAQANNQTNISWNVYSYATIILFTFLQLLHWRLFPKFLDIYYHLLVMSGFSDAGGYVTHAFWEYAPVGRVQLYPPPLHILMLFFYKIGLTKLFIGRLFSCLIYPLTLFVVWQFIKTIFNKRLAFFVLLIFSSSFSLYLSTINLIPFSLALIFGLLVFLCIEKDKPVASGLILGLGFYTHTQSSWLILVAVILYGLLNRIKLKGCLKAVLLAFLISLPISLHQFFNRQYFAFINTMENRYLDINLAIYLLAVAGIYLVFKKRAAYYIFLSIFLGMLPLCFTHKVRYFSGVGSFSSTFLAWLCLDALFSRVNLRTSILKSSLFLAGSVLLFYIFSPTLYLNREQGTAKIAFFDTTLLNALRGAGREFRSTEVSIYYPQYEDKIVAIIEKNTDKTDIIWSDLNSFAGLLSLFSQRAMSDAMLSEVRPYAAFDPISAAKLVILFKENDGSMPGPAENTIRHYGLQRLEETEIAYVYLNPNAKAKEIVPKPLIPTWALFSILLCYLGLLAYFIKKA